ncbi:hypothetical protein J6590_083986 [Homalodisca vitripennis]|nr:hypothetical protein J6590_083986 [Homalodisca vitripennis]
MRYLYQYTGLKIQRLKDVSEANYNAKIDCETLRDVLGINQSIHRYLTVHGLFSVRYLSVKSSASALGYAGIFSVTVAVIPIMIGAPRDLNP